MFPLVFNNGGLLIASDYEKKYNRISDILDQNPDLLDAVHADLKNWGSNNGRESTYSSEQFFRILLVKTIEGFSFRDVIVRIADSTVLRNFTRLFSGSIMNFTVLDTAFKKISNQTWEKINTRLAAWALDNNQISGTVLRLDSTVCESNIHYPTDACLLWDCYRVAERKTNQIRKEQPELVMGHRFHIAKIKKLYTFIATHSNKKRNSTKRKVKKATSILIERVETICNVVKGIVEFGTKAANTIIAVALINELRHYCSSFVQVVNQSRRVFNGEKVPANERIFSIFETHTELLMRGKAHKPIEFGHLVQIGQTKEKFISFYSVEEKSSHDMAMVDIVLEDHKETFGNYPKQFSADKNYYESMQKIREWEEEIDIFAICKKGNRTTDEIAREHGVLFRLAQKFRAGCEGSISVLKRVFGLRRCMNRGFKSFSASIGCTVLCHNLVLLSNL